LGHGFVPFEHFLRGHEFYPPGFSEDLASEALGNLFECGVEKSAKK